MLSTKLYTADEIYSKMMKKVATLPCQEDYARQLCNLVAFHLRKNALLDTGVSVEDIPYQGAIVVAPTGQGKTYLLNAIGKIMDINIIVIDGSSLSREGFKGVSLSQRLYGARKTAKNHEAWKRSILFVDEIDKMKLLGNEKDYGNPMENLLQLYNNNTITAENDDKGAITLDVSRFTIVLGGAFDGLDKIIQQRLTTKRKVGFDFEAVPVKEDFTSLKQVTSEDLKKYGIMPELLGRIGSIITIEPMKKEDYKCLLIDSNGGIAKKYKTYLAKAYGVEFEVDDHAIEIITKKCTESKLGARAINPIVNDVMRKCFNELERDDSINKVILSGNDTDCVIQYKHGEKVHESVTSLFSSKVSVRFIERDDEKLAASLIELVPTMKDDRVVMNELKAFIRVSLYYLKHYCSLSDYKFESLETLLKSTQKDDASEQSTFECMMEESIGLKEDDFYINVNFRRFQRIWTPYTYIHLHVALKRIYEAILNGNNISWAEVKKESEITR